MRTVVVVAGMLLLVGLVSAQSADAPPWSMDDVILYASNTDGSDELEGWVNTVAGDGTDIAMGPSGTCDPHTGNDVDFTLFAPAHDIDRTYVLPLAPAQRGTATLAGPIAAVVHIGAGSCYGEVDVTARLLSGDVLVAEGSVSDHQYNDAGDAAYPSSTIDMEVQQSTFALEGLRFEVQVTGSTGGMLFMSVSEGRGLTRFETDPASIVNAVAGQIVYQDVAGPLSTNLTFANATSDRFVYNWTVPAESTFVYDIAPSAGNVSLRLEAGGELINGTWDAAAHDEMHVPAGDAVVELSFDSFTGRVLLAGAQPSDDDDETPEPPEETPDPAGNETVPDDQDSPLPLFAVVAGLAVAVAARRRR